MAASSLLVVFLCASLHVLHAARLPPGSSPIVETCKSVPPGELRPRPGPAPPRHPDRASLGL
ncbi:hypothetical protein PR202_ga14069 [Eleusine coracana subsp. coracana]|uniref:Uncharacterized protein n=1 Tax=Eleusine coracana subsp. coracana TaxID=191504 RepID=A0AAV5CGK8_ELECO|nr:hypothetical protein PR202_ga14069 [Eleusine coracana subsp. coracana]